MMQDHSFQVPGTNRLLSVQQNNHQKIEEDTAIKRQDIVREAGSVLNQPIENPLNDHTSAL